MLGQTAKRQLFRIQNASALRHTKLRHFTRAVSPIYRSTSNTGRIFGAVGASILVGSATFWALNHHAPFISSDNGNVVQPDAKVASFPRVFKDEDNLTLIGLGVRTVSFLKLKVYVVGFYVPQEDLQIVKKTLSDVPNVEELLLDPDLGPLLVSRMLNAGVRLTFRIVPTRNTDYHHMRDGFIRAISHQKGFKEAEEDEEEAEKLHDGLNSLKQIFSRKKVLKYNEVLRLSRNEKGELTITTYGSSDESTGKANVLGTVTQPLVSELLFLHYLSGKSPSSEPARREFVETLAKL